MFDKNGGTAKKGFFSHTFVYTTHPYGSLKHTYSWGNNGFKGKWVATDQDEDVQAARQAIANESVRGKRIGDASLDDFIHQAYLELRNNPASEHFNGIVFYNCKTEATNLEERAKELRAQSNQSTATRPPESQPFMGANQGGGSGSADLSLGGIAEGENGSSGERGTISSGPSIGGAFEGKYGTIEGTLEAGTGSSGFSLGDLLEGTVNFDFSASSDMGSVSGGFSFDYNLGEFVNKFKEFFGLSTNSTTTGIQLTGTQTSGTQTAGTQTSGTQTAGTQTSGTQTAGTETSGTQTADTQTSGTQTAGTQTAETQTAGTQTAETKTAKSQIASPVPTVYMDFEFPGIKIHVAPNPKPRPAPTPPPTPKAQNPKPLPW